MRYAALGTLFFCLFTSVAAAAALPAAPPSITFTARAYGKLVVAGEVAYLEKSEVAEALPIVGLDPRAMAEAARQGGNFVMFEGLLTLQNGRQAFFIEGPPLQADRNPLADPYAKGKYNLAAVGEVYIYQDQAGRREAYLNTFNGAVRLGVSGAFPDMGSFAGLRVVVRGVAQIETNGEVVLRPLGVEVSRE